MVEKVNAGVRFGTGGGGGLIADLVEVRQERSCHGPFMGDPLKKGRSRPGAGPSGDRSQRIQEATGGDEVQISEAPRSNEHTIS